MTEIESFKKIALESEDPDARKLAIQALKQIGRPALPSLEQIMAANVSEEERILAFEGVAELSGMEIEPTPPPGYQVVKTKRKGKQGEAYIDEYVDEALEAVDHVISPIMDVFTYTMMIWGFPFKLAKNFISWVPKVTIRLQNVAK